MAIGLIKKMLGDAASLDWRSLLAHTKELESIAMDRLGRCNIEVWDESGMAKFLERPETRPETRARKEKQTRAITVQGGRHQSVPTVAPSRLSSPAAATERDHSPDRLSPSPVEGNQSESPEPPPVAPPPVEGNQSESPEPPPVAPPPVEEDQLGVREESQQPPSYLLSPPPSVAPPPMEEDRSEVPEDELGHLALKPHAGEMKCQRAAVYQIEV